VPCSDSNVASIAFEHGDTAIGNTLNRHRQRRHPGDISACADNQLAARDRSRPARHDTLEPGSEARAKRALP
jgi:hypothetical protein